MSSQRYPYDEGFQHKILSLFVQDPQFLPCYHDSVNAGYFEKSYLSATAQLILNYYGTYRVIPEYPSTSALVEDHVARYSIPTDLANSIRSTVYHAYATIITDLDFVKDRVLRFGQRQAMKSAVGQIIDKLEKDDDLEQVRDIVQHALDVGIPKEGTLDFGGCLNNLPNLAAQSSTYSRRVPTLLPSLDGCLMGGLGFGEIGVIVAPAGVGKSTTMTNFGFGGLMAGFNVLHVTLELKEIDIALKYAARLTSRPINEIVKGDPYFYQAVQQCPIPSDRLKIKYFSPGTCTTANIRALLSFLRGQGFYPQLLILDYLKKMKHNGDAVGGLGRICDELVSVGDDFGLGVWTAQQAQRNFRFSNRTSVSGMANDISILENCDVAIAISQSEEEHKLDRMRLELGKVRRGEDVFCVFANINYSNCSVWEMTAGEVRANYGMDPNSSQTP